MVWDRHHQVPDTEPASAAEVIDVLTRAMGRDLGVREVGWLSRFHCDERQVSQYRHGRVFLAGDAAHVHSPMGGQGMNTGIQDAVNLAWKLDAVLSGARDDVLDTYQSERHPIGRRVLRQSGLMTRGVTLHSRIGRAIRNLLAPRLLRMPRVRDAVAGSFAGTELRYARGPGDSPLVGTRATEIPLVEGPLTHLQRFAGFVLIRERCGAGRRCGGRRSRAHRRRARRSRPTRWLHRLGRRLFGQWRDEQCAEPVDRTHPSTAMCIAAR
jgi:flavin-dependent dehydrogenase